MTGIDFRSRPSRGGPPDWARSGRPPSRAAIAATADKLPQALSPPTAIRAGSPPRSPAWDATQRSAAMQSSAAAGAGCSGDRRSSTDATRQSALSAMARQTPSWVSRSPSTQPPPWMQTSTGALRPGAPEGR